MKMLNILAGDIGGTHSRFAHFGANQKGNLTLREVRWLRTADASSFNQLIASLRSSTLSLKPEDADIVAIAIAGPVERGVRSSPPLISWDIDISTAEKDYGFRRCALINDFVAQAFACRTPVGEAAEEVLPGFAMKDAPLAVIGAGTGLGQAALTPDGKGDFIAVPSEGGHTNFPFVSQREFEFQEFLLRKRGEKYITCNAVVSGKGLSYIHQFLSGEELEPPEVAKKLSHHHETIEWAARFYGRVCRNYSLQTLSLGGLYIAGGVAAKEPHLVFHEAFRREFRSSDTLADLLEKIPVLLIKDRNSGLWGAAAYAVQQLKTGEKRMSFRP